MTKKFLIISFLVLCGLFVSRGAEAAIAFDASSTGAWSSGTSFSWSHTITGSNPLLVVGTCDGLASADVDSITWSVGSSSLTEIRSDVDVSESGIWRVPVGSNIGAGTITVNLTATPSGGNGQAAAVSLTGVSQASPDDANSGTNTPGSAQSSLSTNITTTVDNTAIVDALCVGSAITLSMGAQTNRVERHNNTVGTSLGVSTVILKTSVGAQTMNWSFSASRRGGLSIASFKPVTVVKPPNFLVKIGKAIIKVGKVIIRAAH